MYMDNSYLKVHYNILLFYVQFLYNTFFQCIGAFKNSLSNQIEVLGDFFFFSQKVIRLREVEERKSAVICTVNCAGEGKIPGNHFRVS